MTRERRDDGGEINKQAKRKGNMRISILTIGAIASIITINSVFADTTVTTQNYVDSQVETKQDKISNNMKNTPYGGMNAPDSVITDTATDGTVAKRVIIYGGVNEAWGVDDSFIGAQLRQGRLSNGLAGMEDVYGYSDSDLKNGIISAGVINSAFGDTNQQLSYKQKKKVCVQYITGAEETSENCLLWNLPD